MDPHLSVNRANWDDRVPIHVASSFYDVEGWLARGHGPRADELDALGNVDGLDLVHLQCHFGLDTLAFARAGARVTGVDFSGAAIAEARSLAARAGLAARARFVEANALDAADTLGAERFDIVYVSGGSLCWLPSVSRWAAQVATLLRPGGRLYLHDVHPLVLALADDELNFVYSYFEEPGPFANDNDATYTDGGPLANRRSYEWNHSLGEIVTAVLDNGLRLDRLSEHDSIEWPRFPWLTEGADGRWHNAAGQPRLPMTFTLLATRR